MLSGNYEDRIKEELDEEIDFDDRIQTYKNKKLNLKPGTIQSLVLRDVLGEKIIATLWICFQEYKALNPTLDDECIFIRNNAKSKVQLLDQFIVSIQHDYETLKNFSGTESESLNHVKKIIILKFIELINYYSDAKNKKDVKKQLKEESQQEKKPSRAYDRYIEFTFNYLINALLEFLDHPVFTFTAKPKNGSLSSQSWAVENNALFVTEGEPIFSPKEDLVEMFLDAPKENQPRVIKNRVISQRILEIMAVRPIASTRFIKHISQDKLLYSAKRNEPVWANLFLKIASQPSEQPKDEKKQQTTPIEDFIAQFPAPQNAQLAMENAIAGLREKLDEEKLSEAHAKNIKNVLSELLLKVKTVTADNFSEKRAVSQFLLDSIDRCKTPEQLIELYTTYKDHVLVKNHRHFFRFFKYPQSKIDFIVACQHQLNTLIKSEETWRPIRPGDLFNHPSDKLQNRGVEQFHITFTTPPPNAKIK